ncbi:MULTISPECIES: quaternary amine ABC transporter ATP-binding protein [Rhizobium]|uniref:quaternary amine ABC transporter ATP-binding protein n=1 Tax=Rhizobium TaxID=379 RepID=UPI0007EABC2C|nr:MULTISPECIES: ATP-binding cassette domain-containing protein [Rhizobium]ANK85701.1 proline/glycine betaine ABC transporter ATP-binding protein [Rhizobium sp. N731]ANK91613.1 proline/glycine betaine ABC transporter ATP-binding protein [Rhizobium sp. N6212]ANK97647.1 proline/glycine betaine ABC transporter ATP-binding protein [Rhizobium sp. N621]ANL03726.1 proline/glycine betaine ABC transporter ATP-binding protein [Rhizobium esperanzae]ANL09772.1 proline/glycine betaine ABC transporter ATP-b
MSDAYHHAPGRTAPVALEASGVWKVFGADAASFGQRPASARTPEALAAAKVVGAVQDATFRIARGEVFVIMGLSGSGKSTLLRCLTRLIEPTEGEVHYDGENILKLSDKALVDIRRRRMGMVFQHFALLPNRTVLGNIAFPLEVQGMPRAKAEARARELIDTVGLAGREARFPAELSGGQQQRVGIARSLTTNPEFWFLDEPFSALDPLIRADLQAEVLRLQRTQTRTVVFVTHDLDEAIRLADRIAIMEGGRIVQIGTPEELVTRPATDYVRRFVAKVPPARVVRVSSLMSPAQGQNGGFGVSAGSTISEIAPELVSGAGALPVLDAGGRQIGSLDRQQALATLAASG